MDKEILSRIDSLETRVAKLEKQLTVPVANRSVSSGKRMSAKEFLMSKVAKSEAQRVLALGYFLEKNENMSSFNVPDLEAVFRSAKERLPKNINDAVNKNIAKGLLMEAESKKESKKAWYLTSTGETHVEDEMNK